MWCERWAHRVKTVVLQVQNDGLEQTDNQDVTSENLWI